MSKAAYPNYGNLLPGPTTVIDKGAVYSDTAAKHGCGFTRDHPIRNLEDKVSRYAGVCRVTAVRLLAIGVFRTIGRRHLRAVLLFAIRALLAVWFEATGRLRTHAA